MAVTVHEISFRGLAGTIFILLAMSVILFVIGFSTTGWSIDNDNHEGLWERCVCGKSMPDDVWFEASRALVTLGLFGLCCSFVLISIYMCIHSVSKNSTLTALVIVSFLSVIVMAVGFAIYGMNRSGLAWSFAFTVIAGILTLFASILSFVQMRKSVV
ncbi:hypothetical protein CAPTEDRAFT_200812 [Capitella teleta]|uniref:Uncharacterized protein n=1 Tax=Capitella teleta TaxID=283909 RepID=R7UW46_CAPTE|nr:hypothetical protein CAPTEDRAFT_200812 [Capitella teleta]|eukprot:ELU10497.1 hypothetical protein CAPTEDRAFT_200812 [Capitella teleta]